MAKNNSTNQTEERIVTKYDRKVQKRKEDALKEAKTKKITLGVLIVILAAVVVGVSVWMLSSYNRIHKEFIKVNDESVSQIEFDFYYGISKNNNMSQSLYGTMTYGSYYTSYLGYDTSKSDRSQKYSSSTDYTWYDYFANTTVQTIKQYKAILADADKNGFTYDNFDADYESLQNDIKESADEEGVSVKAYYKEIFGSHATESSIKDFIAEYLKATAYEGQLQEKLAATEEEKATYYNENKNDYDQITFRQFIIEAETADDETSLAAAKEKADAMAAASTSETAFAENCRTYATEEQAEKYASDDGSLLTDTYKSSVDEVAAEWLFDSARIDGDITVVEDKTNSKYYVLYFISRTYDESNDETIAGNILNQKYSSLITEYTDKMTVDNINKRIKMLTSE